MTAAKETKISVRLSVLLEVDKEEWSSEYGIEGARANAVRRDVKSYVRGLLNVDHCSEVGLWTVEEVK